MKVLKLTYFGGLILLLFSNYLIAEIVVTPNHPNSSDAITIKVVNQYGSEASIQSATIEQTGNYITITQNIDVICMLPSAPILVSEFAIGPLNPGDYQITVNIHHTGFPSGALCPDSTSVQNATLNVQGVVVVPIGGSYWRLFLIATLLMASLLFLKKRAIKRI